jgi:hypothetical protein
MFLKNEIDFASGTNRIVEISKGNGAGRTPQNTTSGKWIH